MADKIQFYPLDITYKVEEEKLRIYLFGRTTDGKQVCVVDEEFTPYFFVILKNQDNIDLFREKIVKIEVEEKERTVKVEETEVVDKKHLGNKVKAVKVYAKIPSDVPVIRSVIKEWELIKSINEYDIPFVRRYLLDKKITPLSLVEAEGEFIRIADVKVPVLKAEKIEQVSSNTIKKPKVLSFDIETYNPSGKRFVPEQYPIIMVAFYGEDYKKVITWKRFKTEEDYIEFVDGEIDLITRFKEVIEHYKPDVLVGYYSDGFDFPYIITRAKKYKINLDLGLDHSLIKFMRGKTKQIQLTGIVHLDVFKFVKKILGRSLETDSYSLEAVASELLGEGKDEVDLDNLTEAWDKDPKQLAKFCKYNLQDAKLTLNLFKKIYHIIDELVKLIGLPAYDVNRMGFSQLVEWFIMKQVQEFNEIAPNKPHYEEISERQRHTYTGAFVYEPKPGLYNKVVVFDFRSLYPTIIASHNIGLSTLSCDCCKGKAKVPDEPYWFCKNKKGFIPSIIEDLITRRMRVKEIMKKKQDPLLEARSESLKLLANSFYGYLGFYAARWYCLECAKSVTAYGRHYIQKVIDKAKEKEFNVLYGDTDSVMMDLGKKTKEDAFAFVEQINTSLPGLMELEFEGFYPSGIFVSAKEGPYGAKKKYALIDEDGNIKIKGFETIRRNWSFIAKEVQEKVLNIILRERDPEKALKYVRGVIDDLRQKRIPNDKVVIYTQLQKEISEYAAIGPHVAVARKLKAKGEDVGPGSMIKFIVGTGTGIIRDRAELVDEVEKGGYDADYYIEHQVVPAVERIFNVLGYKREDLTASKEQSKLGKFF
ncbi:DNA-directed DNA polymerase [Candidatus Woesearchaeota archaeon]|nr:DNA-directed DNA polymerase [Candidatus Woesearchaeota archaeon]